MPNNINKIWCRSDFKGNATKDQTLLKENFIEGKRCLRKTLQRKRNENLPLNRLHKNEFKATSPPRYFVPCLYFGLRGHGHKNEKAP